MSAATYPSVVVLTHMTFTARRWGQFPTISFSNGAVAGSEVVTVDSSLNINVQISTGVSTMLQVKTAIDATAGSASGLGAGDLVSVAIAGGHNSDAVVTVNGAALAGGTAAAKASRTIGHLVYTAKSAGTAGNSTRIIYTSGATLLISVSSADITVRIRNDGTTTNAQIKTAVEASGPAAALVDLASDGLALSYRPRTNAAPALIALSGGTAAVAPSVILQDLTFGSDKTGTTDNGKTITYTTGAVAGSEVVTVDGSGNASIQISNGVSTATQIKTACDAASSMNGTAASGTATITSFAAMHLTKASGTVTVVDYTALAGKILTVAGHALTEGVEWTAATSNDATADSLAAAIDALTEVDAANPAANAITVVAHTAGTAGNAITLATGDVVNLTISGAVLSGGIAAATVNVNGTTLTESTDFNAVTSNNQTATNLAAAIDALSLVGAAAVGAIVTVTADSVSTAGNSYVFTKTGSGLTLSGSGTLAGGVDGYAVTVSGTGATAQKTVNAAPMTGASAATQPASPNEPPLRVKVIS